MDVLNIVVNVLHLIAEVVIGVIQVTWMISSDVFQDHSRAKHYSRDKKQTTAFQCPQTERSFYFMK